MGGTPGTARVSLASWPITVTRMVGGFRRAPAVGGPLPRMRAREASGARARRWTGQSGEAGRIPLPKAGTITESWSGDGRPRALSVVGVLADELVPRALATTMSEREVAAAEQAVDGEVEQGQPNLIEELSLDAAVAPAWVLASQPEDSSQSSDLEVGRRQKRKRKAAHLRQTSARCQRRSVFGLGRRDCQALRGRSRLRAERKGRSGGCQGGQWTRRWWRWRWWRRARTSTRSW